MKGVLYFFKPDSCNEDADGSLYTAEDNVAHGHVQRCPRPWSTLHSVVYNA